MRKMTEDFIGTCQWCFGEYKTNAHGTMVLHGYQRPGHGSTVGRCSGAGKPPFDYKHDLTDKRISMLREDVVKLDKNLALIDSGKVTKVKNPNFVAENDPRRGKGSYYFSAESEVEFFTPGHDRFDHTLKVLRANIASERKFIDDIAVFLEEAVKNWTRKDIVGLDTPATGRERYVRDAYDPEFEKQREAHLAAKAVRDAKPGKITVNVFEDFPRTLRGTKPSDEEWRAALEAREAAIDVFKKQVKDWAKARFPNGKVWTGRGEDNELRFITGKSFMDSDHEVFAFRPDWQYADEIMAMFPGAHRYDKDTNRRDPVTKHGLGKGKDIRLWVPLSALK